MVLVKNNNTIIKDLLLLVHTEGKEIKERAWLLKTRGREQVKRNVDDG